MAFDFDNVEAVYIGRRLYESERVPGLHYYEIRHNNGKLLKVPRTIRDSVRMHCWGTLVTKKPLSFIPPIQLTREEGIRLIEVAQKNSPIRVTP